LELRFEFYNLWNHTQFTATPGGAGSFNGSVSGNFASSNFGRSTRAAILTIPASSNWGRRSSSSSTLQ